MKYRKLGRTGYEVSEMAHGLWGMSGWSGSEDRESLDALQLASDLGCNFFDTAWAYGEGKSDGLLGEILSRNASPPNPAKRLYAASKIPPLNRKWPARPEYKYQDVFPADHVLKHTDLIREKLRTDSIDLLQFHVWDDSWTDEPEFRDTVEKLKRDGRIRSFGLSLNRWEPGKRPQGPAHRAGRRGAGDLQHFRSGTRRQTIPRLRGIEYWSDRARAARRRQPGRKDDAANHLP